MRFALAFACWLIAGPGFADGWFRHEFGEDRRYLKDWLAVCDNAGAGPCRVVQTPPDDDTPANDRRLALHAMQGGWEISVFDRDLPAAGITALWAVIDRRVEVVVRMPSWRQGEGSVTNIADTVTVFDPIAVIAMIAAMKAGQSVEFHYANVGQGDGSAVFSLDGLTAAMLAVDKKLGRVGAY
ncbi:MAG: DUF1176 domain-containing protein [Pseudomonadota bacterium]